MAHLRYGLGAAGDCAERHLPAHPAQRYVAIMGPSGSGKSTLMNLMAASTRPPKAATGSNGQLVSELDDDQLARIRNKEIGFVFQTFNLLSRATALHNVELPLIYNGTPSAERLERAKESLTDVGLGTRMMHKPTSSPAASASVWPLPVRWSTGLHHPRRRAYRQPRLQNRPRNHGPLRYPARQRQHHRPRHPRADIAEYAIA